MDTNPIQPPQVCLADYTAITLPQLHDLVEIETTNDEAHQLSRIRLDFHVSYGPENLALLDKLAEKQARLRQQYQFLHDLRGFRAEHIHAQETQYMIVIGQLESEIDSETTELREKTAAVEKKDPTFQNRHPSS